MAMLANTLHYVGLAFHKAKLTNDKQTTVTFQTPRTLSAHTVRQSCRSGSFLFPRCCQIRVGAGKSTICAFCWRKMPFLVRSSVYSIIKSIKIKFSAHPTASSENSTPFQSDTRVLLVYMVNWVRSPDYVRFELASSEWKEPFTSHDSAWTRNF